MSKIAVGIDISKKTFDVALILNDKFKTKKFNNNQQGFKEFCEWLTQKVITLKEIHICMEATGSYGDALATYLFDAEYKVSVTNPTCIKGFGQSELSRTKTDKADAQLIARFCHTMDPAPWTPKPAHVRTLQTLVRRLEELQSMYGQEHNRSEVAPEEILDCIEELSEKLKASIEKTKQKIQEHIQKHPELQKKGALLKTIPGIGEATIAQVLAFIGNVEDFKNAKQLAAFVGLNPKQRQSGSSVHGRTRLSKMGNSNLRKALYMPAIVAKRHNPMVRFFCENLKKAGKPPMLIIGAAMRKLVHIIFGVLKSGEPFKAALGG